MTSITSDSFLRRHKKKKEAISPPVQRQETDFNLSVGTKVIFLQSVSGHVFSFSEGETTVITDRNFDFIESMLINGVAEILGDKKKESWMMKK